MNRATRRANLRKLQVTGGSNEELISKPASSKPASSKPTTSISAYFGTPNKQKSKDAQKPINAEIPIPINEPEKYDTSSGDEENATVDGHSSPPAKRSKRTKLATFLGKTKRDLPRARDSDVFEKSAPTTKKAPKSKATAGRKVGKSRPKRQPNIKSAFLRNEEMFSEITAQHCIAENFSPDDMQLALAISQSEAEKCGVQPALADDVVDLVEDEGAPDCIRNKLQKYGFRLAPREDYNAIATAFIPGAQKGKRTKWASKFTALTLRNPEVQMQKLNAKIEAFLSGQFLRQPTNGASNSTPTYSVTSPTLRKIHVVNDAKIISHANLNLLTIKLEDFFVRNLFDVSRLSAGHLLKDWAAIQGRDLSPRLRSKRMQRQHEKLIDAYRDLEQFYEELNMANDCVTESAKDNVERDHAASSSAVLQREPQPATLAFTDAFERQTTAEPPKLPKSCEVEDLSGPLECLPASPLREPPDKKLRLGAGSDCPKEAENSQNTTLALTLLSLTQQLTETASPGASLRDNSSAQSTSACLFATQRARAHSPDLFADSDADISFENGNNSQDTAADALHSITTYEIYSSDEVKTSCSANEMRSSSYAEERQLEANKVPIVDLTQENMSAESSPSPKSRKDLDDLPYCKASRRTDLTDATATSITGDVDLNLEQHKAPILEFLDLTQENMSAESPPSRKSRKDLDDLPYCKASRRTDLTDATATSITGDVDLNLEQHKAPILEFLDLTQENMSAESPPSRKSKNDLDDLPYCQSGRRRHLTEVTPTSITDDVIDKMLKKYLSPDDQQALSQLEKPNVSRRGQSKSLGFSQNAETGSSEDLNMNFKIHAPLFSLRPYKSANFSKPAKPSENYLDLTQSDPEEDNECIILSDDEINYSIRKADTTIKLVDDAELTDDIRDLSFSTDSDDMLKRYGQSTALSQTNQSPCKQADFSLLDLIDVDKSFNKTPSLKTKAFQKSASTLSFDGADDFEPIFSQFLATPSKQELCGPTQNTPAAKLNLLNGHTDIGALHGCAEEPRRSLFQERAEFGILDSHSEPFTQSPFKTPVKTANDSCHIEWEEASFLESPSERPSFAKRYSRNSGSKRFDSLLKSAALLLNNGDDFDEFDKLVYGSPEPKSSLPCNAPAGLSQLLTAEISLMDEYEADNEGTPELAGVSQKFEVQALPGSPPSSSRPCTLARRSAENLTELPQEMEVNGKVLTVRLDTRPKPDFTQQSEAELLKQLYSFGIKPLKRKQAVKMLEFIYNQTHPILLHADQDPPPKETQATVVSHSQQVVATTSNSQTITQPNAVESKKLNLREATGDMMLRFTEDLCPGFDDEFFIFQTNVSKKISQPLLPLHVAWFNLVCSNPELHETILMYEPIDLQEVYLFFKSLGYRYDPKEMKAFFDSRCIIFRYDLAPPGRPNENNRHVRKPKHKKPTSK